MYIGGDTAGTPVVVVSFELVGEMRLTSDEPRSAAVIAVRDSDLLRLPREVVERLVASHSGLACNFAVAARLPGGAVATMHR